MQDRGLARLVYLTWEGAQWWERLRVFQAEQAATRYFLLRVSLRALEAALVLVVANCMLC